MEWLSLTFFVSLQVVHQDPFEDWQFWQVCDAFSMPLNQGDTTQRDANALIIIIIIVI
jgi:hypothetical protein